VKREFDDIDCIEDVLRALIKSHGKDLYRKENSSRLKSFLSDFAGKFPKERKVLNVVIDEGIQEKLLNIDNGTNDEKHYVAVSCRIRLTEDIGLAENRATEAVNILALGLGWETPLSQYVVDQKQDLSETSTIDSIYQQLIELKQEISEISTIEVSDSLGETSPLEKKDDKYDVQNAYLEKQTVLSPIDGTIFRYLVKEGSDVSPDTKILTVISMGVEFEIEAGYSGKVHFITPICSRINNGQPIARIEKLNLFDENLITKSAAKPIIPKTFGNTTQTNNQWQNTQTSETSEVIKTSVANTLLDDKINIGQTVATNIPNENYSEQSKEIIEYEQAMDRVLTKSLPTFDEIRSVFSKESKALGLYKEIFPPSIWEKRKKIYAIYEVLDKFCDGRFVSTSQMFWDAGFCSILFPIWFCLDNLMKISSCLICCLGFIVWSFTEGCICFLINRIIVIKYIRKIKEGNFKFSLNIFILLLSRFILLFSVGGLILGIFAEFVVSDIFLYGFIISTVMLFIIFLIFYIWHKSSDSHYHRHFKFLY